MSELKPCPFCGKVLDTEEDDTLYPSGIGYIDSGSYRYYVSYREVPKEQWCYKIVCATIYGGCGVEIQGDSVDEVIDNWNRRINE